MRMACLCLWSLLCVTSAPAELVFEQRILELIPPDGLHEVEGVFRFQNDGRETIRIRKVRTSCGCTTARLEKKVIEPGEKGEIATTFRFGYAKGALRKLLTIELEDATEIPLEIHAFVPVPMAVKPTLVFWRRGSEAKTKRVSIEISPGLPVRVTGVASDNPGFLAELRREKDRYFVDVTPVSTGETVSGQLTVTTDYPRNDPATLKVYTRVR